ncbi:GSCFA domain-containing protein [Kordiimonas aestuarii]|uniref:GSCFA domain-containing protein n=1 Tax=Kordiimonas aestuarii TaxID=1005925 RepID=UPI00374CF75E
MTDPWCQLSWRAAGEFDSTAHQFVNHDTADIIRDFEAFMHIVLGVNPSLKFVLTVSPVPLVATATPEHIINAA